MPKMKTKSRAAKRFKIRSSGSIKRSQAFKRHILTKKTTKSKRQLRGMTAVHASGRKVHPRHDALRLIRRTQCPELNAV